MGTVDFYIDYEAETDHFSDEIKAEVESRLRKLSYKNTDMVGAAVSATEPGTSGEDRPIVFQARIVVYARPDDAVARSAWWVELHDAEELVHWERFPDNHVYYIPLACMVPAEADNLVAGGRCVDADPYALSAIRVMGPCMAMGTAAAHALDLAGSGGVDAIDMAVLQRRLKLPSGSQT